MHIGLITLRSDIGGGPKHVYDLLVHLKSTHQFEVTTWSPGGTNYANKFKELSDHFLTVPHRKLCLRTLLKILIYCKRNKVNILHSHGRGAGIYSKILSFFGVKVVHTFHGVHNEKGIKAKLVNLFESLLKNCISHGIYCSNSELECAKKIGISPNKYSIIPNGVKVQEVKKTEPAPLLRLGTLTRLDLHKGNHTLIKHVVSLKKDYPNITLVIAGEGEEENNLKSLIENLKAQSYIQLIGPISDIQMFFQEIDLFTSASKGEGLPYSVLEAMSFGVPCLLSNVSGHRDLIQTDHLFEIKNSSSFIEKYQKVNQEQASQRKDSISKIKRFYNIDKNLEEVSKTYFS